MQKVYLKPTATELILKSATQDGHADVFSYDPESRETLKKLGSLFVVGHVQHATQDVAYMVNLAAALAKREYYNHPALSPKESFTNTLKKINEIVYEFFKNQDLKVNLGIFAIAGDQIYISKLGKFKILLNRDGKAVDILNNVDLFERDQVPEKEFSNIVSGRLKGGDAILAFYPGSSVTARERYIKSDFIKLSESEFLNKIQSIKSKNETFSCALVAVKLKTITETAEAPVIQPQELRETATLARQSPAPSKKLQETKISDATSVTPVDPQSKPRVLEPTEVPRIISTEFSFWKRKTPLTALLKLIQSFNVNQKNKTIVAAVSALAVIGIALAVKTFLIVDPQDQKLHTALQSITARVQTAQAKLSQQDTREARRILLGAITQLRDLVPANQKDVLRVRTDTLALLNTIEYAIQPSPTLVIQVPSENGLVKLIAADHDKLAVYFVDGTHGNVAEVVGTALGTPTTISLPNPGRLTISNNKPTLIYPTSGKLITVADGKAVVTTADAFSGFVDFDLYQDNVYLLTDHSILKIPDVLRSRSATKAWLDSKTEVSPQSTHIVVDGNIFVLTETGLVTTYYKGKKIAEVQTSITPDASALWITEQDGAYLYLVDRNLNRIYLLDKKSGALVKTYALDIAVPVLSAAVGPGDVLYLLTSDNKIWQIK